MIPLADKEKAALKSVGWDMNPDWFSDFKWTIKRFWYKHISCRLNHRQKWLTSAIPREYCDKVELIPVCLYKILQTYWIDEGGEESLRYQYESMCDYTTDERRREYRQIYQDLLSAYEWSLVRDELYGSLMSMDNENTWLHTDLAHMQTIVKYHQYLWT